MARIETVAPGEARGLRRLVLRLKQEGLRVRARDHPDHAPGSPGGLRNGDGLQPPPPAPEAPELRHASEVVQRQRGLTRVRRRHIA